MRPINELLKIWWEPLETLLPRFGKKYEWNPKNPEWFRLYGCPWCDHKKSWKYAQCSLQQESSGFHRVKCHHKNKNGGEDRPPYANFLVKLGAYTQEEADAVNNHMANKKSSSAPRQQPARQAVAAGAPSSVFKKPGSSGGTAVLETIPDPKKDDGNRLEEYGLEWNSRLRNNLLKNADAMRYLLEERGLTRETMERFRCGLTLPATDKENVLRGNAWSIPLRHADGKFYKKYINYSIPGVSINPIGKAWSKGTCVTFYADAVTSQPAVIIVEGIKDLMRVDQELRNHARGAEFLLISSTNGDGKPADWHDAAYWSRWSRIYAAQDNDVAGESMAVWVKNHAGRDVFRLDTPKQYGKDWTDFFQNGGTIEEFLDLVDNAQPIGVELQDSTVDEEGLFSYEPVNVQGSYHEGKLYYVTQALERAKVIRKVRDENGIEVEREVHAEAKRTLVVRSDGRLLRAVKSHALPGTQRGDQVVRLDDGTLIEGWPRPNRHGTWSWKSIKAFTEGQAKVRPLNEILADIRQHLAASVWLPYAEDYSILALSVVVTYTQEIFESVGYILLNGEPGTGKTQMGIAMSQICCNGKLIGKISAATIARHIHESRGFVCLDDLEAVGKKSGGDEYYELLQGLKTGYNKHSGVKSWTNMKTGMVEDLNFYGLKMINNTTGIESILGTRTFRIQTRNMPPAVKEMRQELEGLSPQALKALRDELHTWAFMNAHLVEETYKDVFAHKSERDDEISAPLRTIAKLAGEVELEKELELAVSQQKVTVADEDDPIVILKDAVRRLVAQGYTQVATKHVMMEMQAAVDANFGKSHTTDVPEWARVEWVGRQMHTLDMVSREAQPSRPRLWGKQLRVYPLRMGYMDEVIEEMELDVDQITLRQPLDFCNGCIGCPYQKNCDMSEKRLTEEHREKFKNRGEIK